MPPAWKTSLAPCDPESCATSPSSIRAAWRPPWRAAGLRFGESALELFGRLSQRLVDDLGVVDHGHEVGVAVPARNDVNVHMVGDAGPGSLAEVGAQVETVRLHDRAKHVERLLLRPGEGAAGRVVEILDHPAEQAAWPLLTADVLHAPRRQQPLH